MILASFCIFIAQHPSLRIIPGKASSVLLSWKEKWKGVIKDTGLTSSNDKLLALSSCKVLMENEQQLCGLCKAKLSANQRTNCHVAKNTPSWDLTPERQSQHRLQRGRMCKRPGCQWPRDTKSATWQPNIFIQQSYRLWVLPAVLILCQILQCCREERGKMTWGCPRDSKIRKQIN